MTHKTVPIEPTEEMIQAALDCQDHDPEDSPDSEVYYLYKAMLLAAPPDNTVQELREQLNEADRRAGAAERQMQSYVSECQSRKDWIRKAKEEWGVDNSVSFDLVWKEALQLRDQVAELLTELHHCHSDLKYIRGQSFELAGFNKWLEMRAYTVAEVIAKHKEKK